MMPHGAYEDGELEISLAPSANRRAQNKPPDASTRPQPSNGHHEAQQPVAAKKPEQRIGAYSIIRTLGEGSFGKVKLATHRVTNQQVALKIIARKKLISRDMAGRVEREIEYLQLLRHPHIIKLYTVIKTQSEIIMVLEYAGGELFDYIVNNGKMRETEARRFFQQIICAVEYCHRHKIVHRDLKPENLLLDENLNVKIADFGLSNIMTDGNFLRTSCGSPNYAAPEVINGKLYAGPEVDVWSCGVILYVLIVGRLPFDDESIPLLFKKITEGRYVVPSYMSHGAATLIKKCLAVNPINRASIEEIRQDPWFMTDLPAYLQPPVEDFIDTGVDPAKAINPKNIAPHASPAKQQQLHQQVTEKISKTMGYGIRDVQEALAANEPSAIKDAYLIVRENQLMQANREQLLSLINSVQERRKVKEQRLEKKVAKENVVEESGVEKVVEEKEGSPNLADEKGQLLFQVPSPPAWNDGIKLGTDSAPPSPLTRGMKEESTLPESPDTRPNPLLNAKSPRSTTSIDTTSSQSVRPYVSKIGILPSSLPPYHRAFMQAKKAGKNLGQGSTLSTTHSEEHEPHPQTDAEKAETARRLNPHSRSQLKLDEASKRPAGMTPVPAKKVKPTKWQFGIRSRNQPLEAIGCIYRALQKLGAEWEVDADEAPMDSTEDDKNLEADREGASGLSLHHAESMNNTRSADSSMQFRRLDSTNSPYKLPADPWVLRVRWRKDGMYPPGTIPPGSTHSSSIDLRRHSVASLSSSTGGSSVQDVSSPPRSSTRNENIPQPVESTVMHMDIQLYEMEAGVYLVDFKCAGYETADGTLLDEKDVTSPFPLLDMASKLIIQLAEAD